MSVVISSYILQYGNVDFSNIYSNVGVDLVITEGIPLPKAGSLPALTDPQVELLVAQGRTVVGYVNVAVTDTNRSYWNSSWTDNGDDLGNTTTIAPNWLKGQPRNAFGYVVKFWDPDWQKIVIDQAVALVTRGYSGIFLDDVGQYFALGNPGGDPQIRDYANLMAEFVSLISTEIRKIDPNAYVVSNADPYIVTNVTLDQRGASAASSYLAAVDAQLLENQSAEAINYASGVFTNETILLLEQDGSPAFNFLESWEKGILYTTPNYESLGDFSYPFNDLDNTILGGDGPNKIEGKEGNDTLGGGGGDDTLTGGTGNDTFVYAARGFGQDIITDFTPFGPNADQIDVSGLGFGDFETLRNYVTTEVSGAIFNFKFNGKAESIKFSNVSFFSLTSNSFIFNTSTAAQTISGTANDDDLWGRAGADTLNGGAGSDSLTGAAGADRLIGGAGDDYLLGGTGSDVFVYDARGFGFDQIGDFTRGEDKIDFSALGIPDFAALAPFLQQLSSGINQIEFKFDGQNETLFISSQVNSPLSADDFIFNTSTTARTVNGTGSADTLFGGLGSDTLNGAVGNDTLVASGGADILNGGTGADRLIGGAGADIFRGTAGELNGDTIADLAIGERIRFVGVSAAGAPTFSFSLSGNTLNYTGGSLTLENLPAGMRFLTSAVPSDNGIDLILRSSNPPVINSDGGGPTAVRSVAENAAAVTTVQATNPDAVTTLTFAITGGADAARFQIDVTP